MATQPQSRVFDAREAERFAALMAGFDTGNPSEVEAIGKARALRRMVAAKNIRFVDAMEFPEIRKALDDQMQPVRPPGADVTALQAENEDLRGKLAFVVPKLREVTDALTKERKDLVGFCVWAVGIAAVCLLALVKFGIVGAVVAYVFSVSLALVVCKE